ATRGSRWRKKTAAEYMLAANCETQKPANAYRNNWRVAGIARSVANLGERRSTKPSVVMRRAQAGAAPRRTCSAAPRLQPATWLRPSRRSASERDPTGRAGKLEPCAGRQVRRHSYGGS